jgi:predicted ATP-grasp superfamily ATP-dependent carboligase
VYALNDRLRDPLRFSRYCRGCFIYPDDPTQPRAYADDSVANEEVLSKLLLEWGARFQHKPVLFATSDWFARFLSNQQQRLRDKFLFHWVAPELFTTIVDKGRMVRFCQQAGVRVPRTHITRPEDDMRQITRGFAYPALIKPIHRYTAGFPVETAKVLIAQNAQESQGFFEKYPQLKGATLMQELIEGGDDQVFQCTALVNNASEITAYSTVRKLRQYPPGYGSMCYGQTERNDAMAAEAFKLLRALGYRGLGSIEFKYRRRDGGYYFIEMNTRLPWYNGLFADAGVNLPLLAYADLTGSFRKLTALPGPEQHDGTTWVSYHNYRSCYREMKAGAADSAPNFGSHIAQARSYAWWNWSDPAPFLAAGLLAARRRTGSLLRKLGLR